MTIQKKRYNFHSSTAKHCIHIICILLFIYLFICPALQDQHEAGVLWYSPWTGCEASLWWDPSVAAVHPVSLPGQGGQHGRHERWHCNGCYQGTLQTDQRCQGPCMCFVFCCCCFCFFLFVCLFFFRMSVLLSSKPNWAFCFFFFFFFFFPFLIPLLWEGWKVDVILCDLMKDNVQCNV